MSATDAKVVAALRRLMGQAALVLAGEVTAVDKPARTCTVTFASGLEMDGIQLQALAEGDKGLVCIPKIGADCLALALGGGEYLLLQATELDAVYVDAAVEIVINGGSNKGVAKSPALVEQFNKLQDDLNALKNVFSGWTPIPNDGGAALKAAAGSWAGQQLDKTAIDDIQNEKLKH